MFPSIYFVLYPRRRLTRYSTLWTTVHCGHHLNEWSPRHSIQCKGNESKDGSAVWYVSREVATAKVTSRKYPVRTWNTRARIAPRPPATKWKRGRTRREEEASLWSPSQLMESADTMSLAGSDALTEWSQKVLYWNLPLGHSALSIEKKIKK
jgi:hypothetical protein